MVVGAPRIDQHIALSVVVTDTLDEAAARRTPIRQDQEPALLFSLGGLKSRKWPD
jgi:hypothetical protein